MECESVMLSKFFAVSYVVGQVQMGVLPVGCATALLPPKPPPLY